MEYAKNGTLHHYLSARKDPVGNGKKFTLIIRLVFAIKVEHSAC